MEWFRWYHGTVSDPKFAIIAKRSEQPKHVVLSCWSAFLEHASTRKERGVLSGIDMEEIAIMLDLEIEQVDSVYQAMVSKNMIQEDRLSNWIKRQPKREDETGAERKRQWKAKQANPLEEQVIAQEEHDRNATEHKTTLGTCKNRTEQNRTEQIREETSSSSSDEIREIVPIGEVQQTATKMTITDVRFLYQATFGQNMPGGCNQTANEICQRFSADGIRQAFEAAAVHNKPNMAYVLGVLNGGNKRNGARASPVKSENRRENERREAAQRVLERMEHGKQTEDNGAFETGGGLRCSV